ncbi:MAG: aldo/keto reductase [Spirochaetales bacterium]|nr:aldo/keto reductase [Spirochaetales bacterium]
MEKKVFGRTGHKSTKILFGGAAFFNVTQADADRTMDLIMKYGINHIDTAESYGDSEIRLDPWLKHNRQHVFLATKTDKRTYKAAKEELHQSLERLCVDSIDLWQMHCLVDENEWEIAMDDGGVLEAFEEARIQGLVNYLGVTGHGVQTPSMHLKSLERFDFDTVLLPYNYMMMQNKSYASDFDALVTVCKEKNIAIQGIKTIARGPKGENEKDQFHTWYKPLDKQSEIDMALHWAMGNEDIFINSVADVNILPLVLDAATRFTTKTPDEKMKRASREMGLTPLFS